MNGFQGRTVNISGLERLCHPPRNVKRAGSASFDKIRNIVFINVCSDDCSTAKAFEYLLSSSVFHENRPRVKLFRFHFAQSLYANCKLKAEFL